MIERPLRLYESICSIMSINLMVEFEADNLNRNDFNEAFKLLKKRHPYFRMRIIKNNDGVTKFAEEAQNQEANIDLEMFDLEDLSNFLDWQKRLISIGCTPRDHSKSLIYFVLYSYKNKRQLYISINHAGIDGPGSFVAIRDFCSYLDSILDNATNLEVSSLPFYDVHLEYKHDFKIDDLKHEIISAENYLEQIKANPINDMSNDKAYISSKFYQLNEDVTKNLIENCKKNGSTIQGALSVAHLISLIKEKKVLLSQSLNVINCCPCNMRYLFGLNNEDVICGSAALTWLQTVQPNDKIWSLAANASQNIKQLVNSNDGYKWLIKLTNGFPIQPYSIMSSSMGIVNFNENNLKHLKIKDLRFMGSTYESYPESVGTMTHALTFSNKFTFNFTYTYPKLSHEWAKTFSQNVYNILVLFSLNNNLTLEEVLLKLETFN